MEDSAVDPASENASSSELNSGLSQVVTVGRSLSDIGVEDPFDWEFEVAQAS